MALEAATRVSAEAIGLGTVMGRRAAGMAADVIAVPGNPLRDSEHLGNVSLVCRPATSCPDRAPPSHVASTLAFHCATTAWARCKWRQPTAQRTPLDRVRQHRSGGSSWASF
jgi:hypothetical protein